MRDLLGKKGPPLYGADEVNGPMIRQWCEMVEDANPVYWDEGLARQSRFGRLISPPYMLRTWLMDRWWNPDPARGTQEIGQPSAMPDLPIIDIADSMGYTFAVGVSNEAEYLEPFGPGDGRVFAIRHIPEITQEKETHLGRGVFFTLVTDYYVERGSMHVATNRMVQFKYMGSDTPNNTSVASPTAREEGDLGSRKEPQASGGLAALAPHPGWSWGDIQAGRSLPALRLPITVTRCVMAAAGTRDFYRAHHDSAFARNGGAREMFVNTMFNQALLGRFLTDWGGPESFVTRLRLEMRGQLCAGDTATVTGNVTRAGIVSGRKLVALELAIANERELTTKATADLEVV